VEEAVKFSAVSFHQSFLHGFLRFLHGHQVGTRPAIYAGSGGFRQGTASLLLNLNISCRARFHSLCASFPIIQSRRRCHLMKVRLVNSITDRLISSYDISSLLMTYCWPLPLRMKRSVRQGISRSHLSGSRGFDHSKKSRKLDCKSSSRLSGSACRTSSADTPCIIPDFALQ
jgi:hypothetical protein